MELISKIVGTILVVGMILAVWKDETYLAKSLQDSRDSHEIAKDEPNSSEKPNNCEKDCFLCKWLGEVDVCGRCRNRNLFAEADTEPQTDVYDYKGNGKWERSE